MSTQSRADDRALSRRSFLGLGAAGLSGLALGGPAESAPSWQKDQPADRGKPTQFLIACMTLPYQAFPLERALTGIKAAGYKYVAWGTAHREQGRDKAVPILPADAPPAKAKALGKRCRDLGLEPVMTFSGVSPDGANGVEILTKRVRQAAAAGIPQVLTFGGSKSAPRKVWIENLKQLGPVARDHGVVVVVKQHGGDTGTGAGCAEITREVADAGIKVNFDAGNVMDYNAGRVHVLEDLAACVGEVRSFCIKDHRRFPWDQDCGPGLGEIDHYRLLQKVAFTGRALPLCCENIFAPGLPRPDKPEGIDALARRAREFLELVIQGLQSKPK
jgi:sugar phosphate isomerase/epimerase